MAVKNTRLGGTDWVDAEVLEAADQNDTFDAMIPVRINASAEDTAEYSAATNADLGYSKTWTCPMGVNNMIVGFKMVADVKENVVNPTLIRLTMTNDTNSATAMMTVGNEETYPGNTTCWNYTISGTGATYSTQTAYGSALQVASQGNNDGQSGSMGSTQALQGGATYTFALTSREQVNSASTGTQYIKNITLTIYWKSLADVVVSGWA